MNKIKKIYCRVYQFVFRAALPVLPYRKPKVFKRIDSIAEEIKQLDVDSVLLITGKLLKSSGATEKIELLLKENGIKFTVYDKTNSNPTVDNVEQALELYKKENCNCLIAFGGGSPIDCAKAVGARVAYPNKTLSELSGTLKIFRKIPPLFAIPTTAGTGSEATVTAVITDSENKYKYTINSFPLIPHYAVLDPAVTFSLPQSLTATTGMDALTHAVEAFIGRSTTKETRHLAKQAVRFIFKNLETAYADPSNETARQSMLYAAHYAGLAFSKSYVGYIHAVSHSLSGQYNIPHGLANSVLLPIVLEDYGKAVYKQLHELSVVAGLCFKNDSYRYGAKKFISAIKDINARMNIPKTIPEILKEDIPIMAKHADKEANPLYPVPVLMDAKELERLYHKASGRARIKNTDSR